MKTYLLCCMAICFIGCAARKTAQTKAGNDGSHENAKQVKVDTLIKDTLAYMQSEIISKKEKYLNKELSILLNDMKIPIKSYTRSIAPNNRYIVPSISLSFNNSNETSYRIMVFHDNPVIVWVKWATPLPADSVSLLLIKSKNKGEWEESERQYYGKQIVKDFGLVDFKR